MNKHEEKKSTSKEDFLKKDFILQQEDSSSTQDNSGLRYERHIVEGTPFTIVESPKGYGVYIGRHLISEIFTSYEKALEDTERTDWERLIQIIQVVFHAEEEIKKLKNLEVV